MVFSFFSLTYKGFDTCEKTSAFDFNNRKFLKGHRLPSLCSFQSPKKRKQLKALPL